MRTGSGTKDQDITDLNARAEQLIDRNTHEVLAEPGTISERGIVGEVQLADPESSAGDPHGERTQPTRDDAGHSA